MLWLDQQSYLSYSLGFHTASHHSLKPIRRFGFLAATASNLLLMVFSFEFIAPSPSNEVQQNWQVTAEQKLSASVCEDNPHKRF